MECINDWYKRHGQYWPVKAFYHMKCYDKANFREIKDLEE